MHSPYTPYQLEALLVAQSAVGLTLTAVLWAGARRARLATLALLLSTWIAVLCPAAHALGGVLAGLDVTRHLLLAASILAGVGALLSGSKQVAIPGALGAALLIWARERIEHSDWDVAGAILVLVGLVLGLHAQLPERPPVAPRPPRQASTSMVDGHVLIGAVTLAALVATVFLRRHTSSGDEWANTYQAALFWKGHAYEAVPRCAAAFRSFWVYPYEGRQFAQYLPGWPLFMAPFVGLGGAWLAGPAAFGLLGVGVARLSRRAAAMNERSAREVRAAGILGAVSVCLGSMNLINGASRYPHVFTAALFVWSADLVLGLDEPGLGHRMQWIRGALLGTTGALLLGTRPSDGAMLGLGLATVFIHGLARRRLPVRAILATFLAASVVGAVMLVILRLQLGEWLKTGYSITTQFYPWNTLRFSVPKPDEIRAGLPFASGSYCWWPCAPAIGVAGLVSLRGEARRVTLAMGISSVAVLAFYVFCEIGRSYDRGFGPRYQFVCVVPMAVGGGVLLARLWQGAQARRHARTALAVGGPFALALTAMLLGTIAVAPMIYPPLFAELRGHNRLTESIVTARLHHALVLAHDGVSDVDSLDLTENLPLSLYPEPDVIVARSTSGQNDYCAVNAFPGRAVFDVTSSEGKLRFDRR